MGAVFSAKTEPAAVETTMDEDFRPRDTKPRLLDKLLSKPPASLRTQLQHAWNPEDCSFNIFVKKSDKLTLQRKPVAQCTDCIRGNIGYTKGLHVWQIHWKKLQRGSHACVGVATADAQLSCRGYHCLLGSTQDGWGWNLKNNLLYHNCEDVADGVPYPVEAEHEEFVVSEEFLVVLDMDEGTLGFVADGRYLGVAFTGLKGKKLFPSVSTVWGRGEITMKYFGGMDESGKLIDWEKKLPNCKTNLETETSFSYESKASDFEFDDDDDDDDESGEDSDDDGNWHLNLYTPHANESESSAEESVMDFESDDDLGSEESDMVS